MKSKIGMLVLSLCLIAGVPEPVLAGDAATNISNIQLDKSTVNAGGTVKITFDVSLREAPTTPYSYGVNISAEIDENGEPWTNQQWSGQARLDSGDQTTGHWSATVTVDASAYTGSYVVNVTVPNKSLTRETNIPLSISGSASPAQPKVINGTISNVLADKSTVNAGGSIKIGFDVALSDAPPSPYSYNVYISGVLDENGDSWTNQQWSAPARLESGNQVKGHWSATVAIDGSAYTGSFVVGVGVPTKLFKSSAGPTISVSGTTAPIPTSSISGTISNLTTSTLTLKAEGSYDFYFDVTLSSTPSTPIAFVGGISAAVDENGEPWTEESWWNKATLVSGNQTTGRWKVTINIPSSAYTGNYVFTAGSGFSKLVTSKNKLNVKINGVTPTGPITAYYTFSNQVLTNSTILRGNTAEGTFRLKTNDTQVQTPECIIDGAGEGWSRATLVSGNKMDGNWKCSLLVIASAPPATYEFHMAVVGFANKIKNEERVILPLKVVANAADLLVPSSNNAFITTTTVAGTSILTSDSIGQSLAYQASSTPVARIFITQGSGIVVVAVIGPGVLGTSNVNIAGRALVLTRSANSPINLYLFPDGTQGRSTISITVSGQANIKTINFGNFGGVSPAPTVKPTITPKPGASESPKNLITPTPTVKDIISPKPTTSGTPKTSTSPTPAIKKSVTINCSNGKSSKKVTGTNPKCPSGYKKILTIIR